jgi:hypothetical protein
MKAFKKYDIFHHTFANCGSREGYILILDVERDRVEYLQLTGNKKTHVFRNYSIFASRCILISRIDNEV